MPDRVDRDICGTLTRCGFDGLSELKSNVSRDVAGILKHLTVELVRVTHPAIIGERSPMLRVDRRGIKTCDGVGDDH